MGGIAEMAGPSKHRRLEKELSDMLCGSFSGLTVEVDHSDRWGRMCVTFCWDGFTGLLPEERFHRLVNVIPEEYRNTNLAGFVWLELTQDETVEAFLKLPRSEDIGHRELEIDASLRRAGFFDLLRESMGPSLRRSCPGDFTLTEKILTAAHFATQRVIEAKLLFIRFGVYCDCQALQSVDSAITKRHAAAS